MDFFLFLLVNFTLFVRPAELIPGLEAVPIYNYLTITNLLLAAPRILEQLRFKQLLRDPVTFCVVGLLAAIFMSHMVRLDTIPARYDALDFSKTLLYYLLLITVVNTLDRLRSFMSALAIFASIAAMVAILHYYGVITVPSLRVLEYSEAIDEATGAVALGFRRMQGTGIFADPNDLSMMAVIAFVVAAAKLDDRQLGPGRIIWLIPAAIMLATVGLTKSRGGTLGLGVAILVAMYLRYGTRVALLAASFFLPVASVFVAGRGDAMSSGTGRSRVELWSAGLQVFKEHPLFGAGAHRCPELIGQEAHNTFVHCFVDLGLFGGALFLGAFWFAVANLWMLRKPLKAFFSGPVDQRFSRLNPYILAILAGACTSMFSISRAYVVTPYLVLGMADSYMFEARRRGLAPSLTISPRRSAGLVVLSVVFLVGIYVFIRVSAR